MPLIDYWGKADDGMKAGEVPGNRAPILTNPRGNDT
jgi:hypothetical protein